ncbi:hypothetical protein Clacol_009690 [Clathrus columnatus]|uniref:GH16 domain-containing protein n=1 Tax=Clathrus columnatus TaxID=1419009 RepID=A0AAV5ARN9_9AGAM|nr:hypothetical protein Clacol_009690 [Clathrus columnatus]
MKSFLASVALSLLSLTTIVQAQNPYKLTKTYAGPTFFDDWIYYNNFDNLTNGDAIFVSKEVATADNLTFINSAGNAVIRVDNFTQVPFNIKRNTVRISTAQQYGVGSVWTADMIHGPFGCSVWPAWWSQSLTWPAGGEIDTFENVNQATANQISLHTNPGCSLSNTANFTGNVISSDCSATANNNQGCIVADNSNGAFGQSFSANGGGVFVTEYAATYIAVWFLPRASIPSPLNDDSATTLDTSTIGEPLVNYTNAGCNIAEFFTAQELILDITLCGDFAGNPMIFNETCQGVCYNDFVIGPPSNYDNAYFEIRNIKVFQNDAAISASGSSSSSSSSGSGSNSGSGSSSSSGSSSGSNSDSPSGGTKNSASGMSIMSTGFISLLGAALLGSTLL